MIYPHNFEQKVGFDQIRQLIKEQCLSALGKEQVDEMTFASDFDLVLLKLSQTGEFVQLITSGDEFPTQHFYDLREELRRIKVIGTWLSEAELFNLARSLETLNAIVRFFKNTEPEQYVSLKKIIAPPSLPEGEGVLTQNFLSLDSPPFGKVVEAIASILDKFGKIKNSASPKLANIRREMPAVQSSISKSLTSILRAAQAEGFVEKDTAPSLRDGRLVIPVNPAFKRKIRGIVHDESASGKTVYIEPAEVVEANNRIRELEAEERREIIKILTEITNFIRPQADDILQSCMILGKIDFIRAKALFAQNIHAIKPSLENVCRIDWGAAVHPLLYLSLKKKIPPLPPEGGKVSIVKMKNIGDRQMKNEQRLTPPPSEELGGAVPLDIQLNEKQRILLISGPNAGGKSVCLKTVGLLQYMLQCGLLVPMHESSRCGLFERLFIDIGDEQSIENDLSTYSSHLTNMKFFIRNSGAKTLLLIDEFGSGTEPHIGGAIAEGALHKMNENRAFGVITTHYSNLKHFAEATEGIENASMLYDRHLMQPLFQLATGNPGSSFAIEIARKIGLPEEVINYAQEKAGSDYIDFDKHLQDIARDKRYWETKRQNIRLKEKELDRLTEKYDADLKTFESQRKTLLNQAKTEAQNLVAQANSQIENTIRKIKESQAEKEKTREARTELEKFKQEKLQEAPPSPSEGGDALRPKKNGNTQETLSDRTSPTSGRLRGVLRVGDAVQLKGQSTTGRILGIQEKTATVAFGNLKSSVKIDRLQAPLNHPKGGKLPARASATHNDHTSSPSGGLGGALHKKRLNFATELDIRGLRADEALQTLMYFIDEALMFDAGCVRILHGTGTGALRQVVRDYLAGLKAVKRFADEHVQFGGAGITVVEF